MTLFSTRSASKPFKSAHKDHYYSCLTVIKVYEGLSLLHFLLSAQRFPCHSIPASIILLSTLCPLREMQPLWSCDKTLPMKWCTTGGPVLHLGRCCGTPLCGNLLEEVEDAGMRLLHTASINTHTHARAPSQHRLHARSEGKKKKIPSHFCCNMTSREPSGKLSVHQHPRLNER